MLVRGSRWITFALFCLVVPSFAAAQGQDGTVLGIVRNSQTQQPIGNAQVTIVGTRLGAQTGDDGRFAIPGVPAGARVVQARRIGFQMSSAPVTVLAGQPVTVELSITPAVITLDEMVVTGSAVATSIREVGTSIGRVDTTAIRNSQAATIDAALQGKIAGVQITQNSGNPGGGGITVRMRGTSSIISGSDPLYIVDGVIVDNSSAQLRDLGARSSVQNRLADINPADIERIEVIRGAAAAALYGSRANNGVVQIFTKRGTEGRPRATLNVRYGRDELPRRLGLNAAPLNTFGVPVQRFDYQDQIFRTGDVVETNLSVSGGTQATTYYLSGGLLNQQGIVDATSAQRQSIRLNLGQELSSSLRIDVGANYVNNEAHFLPNGERPGGVLTALVFTPTDFNFFPNESGVYPLPPTGGSFANPLLAIDRFEYPEITNRFIGSARTRWSPSELFALDYNIGFDTYTTDASEFVPRGSVVAQPAATGLSATAIRASRIVNQDLVATSGYDLGSTLRMRTSGGMNLTNQQLRTTTAATFDLLPTVDLVAGGTPAAAQSEIEVATLGFYAEQVATWRDILTINGSLRADAASNFGENERWQLYPKAQLSYVVGEEEWFQNSFLGDAFGTFRFRTAIGYAGNQPSAANAYSRFDVYNRAVADGRVGLVNSTTRGNEDLRPERQREFEVGVDFGILTNRINAEVTYYDKLVDDLLLFRPIARSSGFATQFSNIGSMSNKGWEALVTTQNINSADYAWTTTFNYSANQNRVESLTIPAFVGIAGYPNRVQEGLPVGVFYGQTYLRNPDGSIQTNANGTPIGSGSANQSVIGDPNPDWNGSVLNELSFRDNVRFRVLFDGTFGNDVVNLTRRITDIFLAGATTEFELLPFGDPRRVPNGFYSSRAAIFEEYVEDGSFVKLREVSLTYNVTQPFVTRYLPGGLELTVAGRNLYTWTDYTGYDPELNLFGQNTVGRGFDFATYPIPRTVAFSARFSY